MSTLVTGGAGFIGSNLVRCLAASGEKVVVVDDLSSGASANLAGLGSSVRLHTGDVRDVELVRRLASDAEVVYHLAASSATADPLTAHSVNVEGTHRVLSAARLAGVRRVVFASSRAMYGRRRTRARETDLPRHLTPYASSKLAAERICGAFAEADDLETVSLRFFDVFGPRQNPSSEYAPDVCRVAAQLLRYEPPTVLGSGTASRDYTFVANAVQALLLAAHCDDLQGDVINVGSGRSTSLLSIIGMLGETLDFFQPPVCWKVRRRPDHRPVASIEKAGRLLGYSPLVPVADGLAQTIEWIATNTTARAPAAHSA